MNFIIAILVVLVGAADVLVIGVSYGIKQIHIKNTYNLLISIIAGSSTYLAIYFGNTFNNYFNPKLGNFVSGIVLLGLASKSFIGIIKTHKSKKSLYHVIQHDPQAIDINKSGTIEPFEMLILSLILSINNLGLGISAGLAGLNIYLISGLSILFSGIFLSIGYAVGSRCRENKLFSHTEEFSAIIIALLGLYILIS